MQKNQQRSDQKKIVPLKKSHKRPEFTSRALLIFDVKKGPPSNYCVLHFPAGKT